MSTQLTPIFLNISANLKDKLKVQAKKERIPMVTLITEVLEMGLPQRKKIKKQIMGGKSNGR
jgi:hypothetical protein